MGKETQQNIFKKNLPAIFLFAALAVFLFWRARFGYCYQDEPFLVSLAQRLYQGDCLLTDEWSGAQNTGVLLLSVYSLAYRFLGGTEGILLAIRWVYCALWLCCLVFLSVKLRELGSLRFAAVIYTALFSPLDYMTLSYTSISLMCVTAMAAISYKDVFNASGFPVRTGLLLGVLMTAAVLCYPHFVPVFFLYTAALSGGALYCKKYAPLKRSYYRKTLLSMLLSTAVFAALYALCVLLHKDGKPLAENVIQIFNDPQHAAKGMADAVIQICYFIGIQGVGWIYPVGMLLLTGIALLPLRCRKALRPVIFIAGVLLFVYSLIPVALSPKLQLNEQMRNIVFLGLLAYALTENRPKKLFYSFYPLSLVYMYSAFLGSNTQIMVISMGLSVAGIAAVVIILILMRELFGSAPRLLSRLAAFAAAAAVLFEIGVELNVRFRYTYYDETLSRLTETLTRGPARGIRTCRENSEAYYETLDAFDTLMADRPRDGKSIMSVNELVSLYADMEFDTLSTWLRGYANTEQMWERQKMYYELNGREYPDYLFFDEYVPYDIEIDGYDAFESGSFTLLVKK